MFLDGPLRALTAEKKRLVLRGELDRKLLRLEWGLAGASLRRRFADVAAGMSLARNLLSFLRRR